MMEQDQEIMPPGVAQMYQEGLHLSGKAMRVAETGEYEHAAALAAIAQARFAGVQTAAFAASAMEFLSESIAEGDSDEANAAAFSQWKQIHEMSARR